MNRQELEKKVGVLPSQWIQAAIADGLICAAAPFAPGQVQPNSLDLRLDGVGSRVQCSFLPGEEGVASKLNRFRWYDVRLHEDGVVLEPDQVYLFPLCESLRLPPGVAARANPKSTTGRLDVFTRVVTEHGAAFDVAPPGYEGKLYLEVVPRSFALRVRQGDSLAQIRFQNGDPALSADETRRLLASQELLLGPDLRTLRPDDVTVDGGLVLSISLPRRGKEVGKEVTVGYQARKNTAPVDLRAVGQARVRHYWDRIYGDARPVILEPDEFYIFASRELVRLPPDVCAEMVPFDAGSGEIRTHYAGFFDSGFGFAPGRPARDTAAAVVLEVRSRDVPFFIEDGQPLFRVNLMRCSAPPDFLYGAGLGSHYQGQRLRLSKQFTAQQDDDAPDSAAQPRLDLAE